MESDTKRSVAMRTSLLSEMVTDHSRKIGALKPNEKYLVEFVDVQQDVTVIEGDLVEEGTIQ